MECTHLAQGTASTFPRPGPGIRLRQLTTAKRSLADAVAASAQAQPAAA